MIVKYTINTPMLTDAIKMAQSMASMNGFKSSQVTLTKRIAGTEWEISLLVSR